MEGGEAVEVLYPAEEQQDLSPVKNRVCRWSDHDVLLLAPISGIHNADNMDAVFGANVQIGKGLFRKPLRDLHFDHSHVRSKFHVLDQIRRHEPLHESIRDVSLRKNGNVPTDLLKRLSLLVGVHLGDDVDVITLFRTIIVSKTAASKEPRKPMTTQSTSKTPRCSSVSSSKASARTALVT